MIYSRPVFVKSKFTGGHYAFKTKKSKKPFENPMNINRSIKLLPNDIVCDIGAYVGEYSMWASKYAKKVYSYEPTPYTFSILKQNKRHNMELINMAVVGTDEKHINLYLSKGIGVTNSVVKEKDEFIKVPAIKYEKALRDATVVKIDVEGAEYKYMIIQPQLRAIILEFHPIAKKPWREWALNIMTDIEASGYKPVKRPTFKSGWSLTGSWQK